MIIQNLTDTDLYKISMQQAAWRQYPHAHGQYELAVRSANPAFPLADIAGEIREEIMSFEHLSLQNDEYCFIQQTMPWIRNDYLDWLADFRFYPDAEVSVSATAKGGIAVIPEGKWHRSILYEDPILAVVEQLYCAKAFGMTEKQAIAAAIARLVPKVDSLKLHPRLCFTDFGTRRRFSRGVHKAVLTYLKQNCHNLVGTSNVWFAKEFGLKAVGTIAHEWTMAHLALVDRLDQAQKRALHVWQQEYGDQLGTALTDTFTTEAFWRDFDSVLARSFSGVRHDSGNPFQFGYAAIAHYKKLGIDPRTKSIIFSDNLNFQSMIALFEEFVGMIGVGFGIGTNLMNDVGFEPLSIVMKLMFLNNIPLVKIGDGGIKRMGQQDMMNRVCQAYGVKQ